MKKHVPKTPTNSPRNQKRQSPKYRGVGANQRPKKAEIASPGTIGQSGKPTPETIVVTTETKNIQPLNPGQTLAPGQAAQPGLTLDDFDEEDVTNAYGAILESGALMLADVEITLKEDRIKKRGRQLYKVMKKYNLNFEYLDLMFVGVGVLGDCMNVYQQVKIAKHEKGEQTETPSTPPTNTEKPQESESFKELQARVKI